MSNVRLGPTSYLILGMVALRGSSTPYELKRAVQRSVGYFWPFPHTQFYQEPPRLTRAGLLTEEREEGGRRRRTYAITERGREALRAWLRKPVSEPFELRDLAELKLFFSELATTEDLVALARTQEQLYRQRLAEVEAIAARFGDDPTRARRLAPLRLGVRMLEAAVSFWADLAQNPP